MKQKTRQKVLILYLIGFTLLAGLYLFSTLGLAKAPTCEDYCFNWFWNCYSRPELLNYCTDGMMQCLINYCGW